MPKLHPSTRIQILPADYTGTWSKFLDENSAFLPDIELDRIEKELSEKGTATHIAGTAGEFVFLVESK